jgi:hypothetical protein
MGVAKNVVVAAGCGYKITLRLTFATNSYDVKESTIPDHHTNVEENPDNVPWDKSVSERVDVYEQVCQKF